jgi:hypothetical protein
MPKTDDDYAINYGPHGIAKPVNIKEANRLIRAMRAQEFITETTGKHHPHHKAALKGVGINRDSPEADSAYHRLRTGMALAATDGTNVPDVDHESFQGTYWTEYPYTKEEFDMFVQARKVIPSKHKQITPWKDSVEPDDTHKVSPVASKKKNRYGV